MSIRGWICIVQAALFVAPPCHGAPIPMGVARVGSSPGVKAVQGRLERWLEGEQSRIRRVQEGVSPDALEREKARARMIRLLEKGEALVEGPPSRKQLQEVLSESEQVARTAAENGWGPLLQRWYRLRALSEAFEGDPAPWVARSRAIHPQGRMTRAFPGPQWFERWRARPFSDVAGPPRQCHWSLAVPGEWWVNGFAVQGAVATLAAGVHTLTAHADGQWFSRQVECRRPSRQQWDLRSAVPLGNRHPEQLTRRYGVEHLWMVERGRQGGYQLIVYTPGFGAEEIALDARLNDGGLLSPFDGDFAVDWEKARRLLQSHRGQVLAQRGTLGPGYGSRESVETPAQWYNDWKFWAITAGVVGGVLAVISLTRKDQVQTQAAPGIAVTF